MNDRTLAEKSANGPPDIHDFALAVEDPRTGSWALTGLLALAVVAALYCARDVVLPVVLALILSMVLTPAVRGLRKMRIPAPIGAGIVLLLLFAALFGAVYNLTTPAGIWLDKAPQGLREIGVKLRYITGQVKDVTEATEQVQDLTQDMAGGDSGKKVQVVTVKTETLAGRVLAAVREFALSAISTLVLLYFLLASGDLFLRKIIVVTPNLSDKKRAVDITRQIEAEVSSYLLTVAMINTGLGCAVGFALYFLGVPNPALWGVMVGLFNFVPYLGDLASVTVLTIVGLLSFDPLWRCLLVPGVFAVLTAAEGYLITPMILGRRLSLNPVVIVVSVLFWAWMWGIPGTLLAVPILVAIKTFCDRVEPLKGFGAFLAG